MWVIKRNSQYYAKVNGQVILTEKESEAFRFEYKQVAQAKANSLKIFYNGEQFEVIKIWN